MSYRTKFGAIKFFQGVLTLKPKPLNSSNIKPVESLHLRLQKIAFYSKLLVDCLCIIKGV